MTPLVIIAWAIVALVAYITAPLWLPLLILVVGSIMVAIMFLIAWIFELCNIAKWVRNRKIQKSNKKNNNFYKKY